jgi:hypothetical protein
MKETTKSTMDYSLTAQNKENKVDLEEFAKLCRKHDWNFDSPDSVRGTGHLDLMVKERILLREKMLSLCLRGGSISVQRVLREEAPKRLKDIGHWALQVPSDWREGLLRYLRSLLMAHNWDWEKTYEMAMEKAKWASEEDGPTQEQEAYRYKTRQERQELVVDEIYGSLCRAKRGHEARSLIANLTPQEYWGDGHTATLSKYVRS